MSMVLEINGDNIQKLFWCGAAAAPYFVEFPDSKSYTPAKWLLRILGIVMILFVAFANPVRV